MTTTHEKKSFPAVFWTANIVELFERSAYYAVFIAITLYLTNVVGYNDVWAAWIGGIFSAGMYLLPMFTGAIADRIGFRKALLLAFGLLSLGYAFLGLFPYKSTVPGALVLLMFGGSFIKSIITGTVAKTTSEENRARGYSIFYALVNVGSFLGKTFAFPLRVNLGVEYINFYSAALSFLAFLVILFFFKMNNEVKEVRKASEILRSLAKLFTKGKLVALILIVSGFWMIQYQMYATMPKYVIRLIGEHAKPEWISNVNPFVVLSTVYLITAMMKKVKAVTSMIIGMAIMPISALAMALGSSLQGSTGSEISIFGLWTAHPITVMMIVGIAIQGLAECFINPRYLEYFSLHAPKGEEGLYLGFAHLHSFFSSILGFGISGYLLTTYCPDPKTVAPENLATAYEHAHYIWYYFVAIGFTASIALLIFNKVAGHKEATTA